MFFLASSAGKGVSYVRRRRFEPPVLGFAIMKEMEVDFRSFVSRTLYLTMSGLSTFRVLALLLAECGFFEWSYTPHMGDKGHGISRNAG